MSAKVFHLVVAGVAVTLALVRPAQHELVAGHAKVQGRIVDSTTWKNKIFVTDTVTVASEAVLTILPGAEVAFAAGAGLVVEGQLVAEGREKEPIVFRPVESGKAGSWAGITLKPGPNLKPAGSRLRHCRLSAGAHGILVIGAGTPPTIADAVILDCKETGLCLVGVNDAVLERNRISGCGHHLDESQSSAKPGGIWIEDSRQCVVRDNVIKNCRRYGIVFFDAKNNTAQGNLVESIGGKPRSTEGYGIHLGGSAGNLLQSNRINGVNYLGIGLGDSPDNLILDNEVRNAPDGLAMTGPKTTGNLARNNRIHGCYWSQIYLTSGCRDNRLENTDVFGGGGAITTHAAGPNTFEGCDFHGTGPIALLGASHVILRRCTISCKGPDDLWTEFHPTCHLIDCKVDRKRIGFSKGTTKDSEIVWKHTLEVRVVDAKTGKPIAGAMVSVASEKGTEKLPPQATSTRGVARFEVTEGTLKKGGAFRDESPHRLEVAAKGYRSEITAAAVVRQHLQREVALTPQRE